MNRPLFVLWLLAVAAIAAQGCAAMAPMVAAQGAMVAAGVVAAEVDEHTSNKTEDTEIDDTIDDFLKRRGATESFEQDPHQVDESMIVEEEVVVEENGTNATARPLTREEAIMDLLQRLDELEKENQRLKSQANGTRHPEGNGTKGSGKTEQPETEEERTSD